MATCTFDICKNTYVLTYFQEVILYGHFDFEPVHRVRGRDSTRSKASSLGDNAPEAGEYQIRISLKISVIASGDFPKVATYD